jgi:Family of unknown function (DUF6188)
MQLTETKDGWHVQFDDAKLTFLHIDFRLTLDITETTGTISLILEQQFYLRQGENVASIIPSDTASIAPVLPLFNSSVDEIEIRAGGHLNVGFTDGHSLNIGPHPKYEAWQLGCTSDYLFVCEPGGYISEFRQSAPS